MSVNSKNSKRNRFANLTMPIDENSPSDRELVLGEKNPFEVMTKKEELAKKNADLKKSESTDVNTETSTDIDTVKTADSSTSVSSDLNKQDSAEVDNNKLIEADKPNSENVSDNSSQTVDKQKTPDIKTPKSTDSKKSGIIKVDDNKSNDLDTTKSKNVVTDSSLHTDLQKSESVEVDNNKIKKVTTNNINKVVTDKSALAQTLSSLKVEDVRLISSEMLPTRKKRQANSDENSKQKHLPPGRAHLTGNIDIKLHGRMKLFALLNDIFLMDVAESGMSVYMDILDIPHITSIVKEGQTINDAIVAIVKEAVNKKLKQKQK